MLPLLQHFGIYMLHKMGIGHVVRKNHRFGIRGQLLGCSQETLCGIVDIRGMLGKNIQGGHVGRRAQACVAIVHDGLRLDVRRCDLVHTTASITGVCKNIQRGRRFCKGSKGVVQRMVYRYGINECLIGELKCHALERRLPLGALLCQHESVCGSINIIKGKQISP